MAAIKLVYYAPPGDTCAQAGRAWLTEDCARAGIALTQVPHWAGHAQETVIVAGLTTYSYVHKLLREAGVQPQGKAEGVLLRWVRFGTQRLLVAAGTDARGLMYALSELGDVVRCGGMEALLAVPDTEEYPDMAVRGSDRFVMGPRDDDWYYSEDFWREHIQKLARCRLNRFTFIVGNDTWYMTPMYPFFVETPGYEQVTVAGQTPARREATLRSLQWMSEYCHLYGLEFILSSWQQLPWTTNQALRVENIPTDDAGFTAFCAKGVQTMLKACPCIDGIQFRFNMEAGVSANMPTDIRQGAKDMDGVNGAKHYIDGAEGVREGHETHNTFWYRMIDALAGVGRHLKIDMRMKGLTDDLIAYVMESGLEPVLATKNWCEHMGASYPYPARRTEEKKAIATYGEDDYNAQRRYSYDNVLEKPHAYDMVYRLWNYGSAVLFLWGDPAYVRRFSASSQAGHGVGYTFCEPLSLKGGQAIFPGEAWPVHTDPRMRTYAWEDDRYWMFYLAFGRVGYARAAKEEVWRREFRQRFGKAAGAVERLYRYGSRVMPLIITTHFPRHPSQHNWPELFAGAALYKENNYVEYMNMYSYATALPSDEQLFASIDQAVEAALAGKPLDAFSPLAVRDWYETIAAQMDIAIAEAEAAGAGEYPEWYPTRVDFEMIRGIARYHAWMIAAAWQLSAYEKAGDAARLARAYGSLLTARAHWAQTATLGDQHYARNLLFDIGTGIRRNGNWTDRLAGQIDKDIATLEAALRAQGIAPDATVAPLAYESMDAPVRAPQDVCFTVPCVVRAGERVALQVQDTDVSAFAGMRAYYRHTNHREDYQGIDMVRAGDCWTGEIPAAYVTAAWDMFVYFVGHTYQGTTVMLPGMYSRHADFPFFVVRTEV